MHEATLRTPPMIVPLRAGTGPPTDALAARPQCCGRGRAASGHLQFLQGSPRVLLMVVVRSGFCPVSSNGPLTRFSGSR